MTADGGGGTPGLLSEIVVLFMISFRSAHTTRRSFVRLLVCARVLFGLHCQQLRMLSRPYGRLCQTRFPDLP